MSTTIKKNITETHNARMIYKTKSKLKEIDLSSIENKEVKEQLVETVKLLETLELDECK